MLVAVSTPLLSESIPPTTVTALDGHVVQLPKDLSATSTVLILGFGRHSSDATTAWERPVRMRLAHPPAVGFYDMAMIAEVPGFMRSIVTRTIRSRVPEVLRPNFLPLTGDEAAWKSAAHYDAAAPEAAYILLVDHSGSVRWSTHAAFGEPAFAQLVQAVQHITASPTHP